jgi:hypothetical protein
VGCIHGLDLPAARRFALYLSPLRRKLLGTLLPEMCRLHRLVASVVSVTASCCLADPLPTPEGMFIPPLPALVRHATRTEIPLEGIHSAPTPSTGNIGDTVVALVSLSEGARVRQWLLQLTVVELTAEETALPPPQTQTWHTSIGSKISFEGARTAVALRLIGPAQGGDRRGADKMLPEKTARAILPAGFLRLGFDRAAATMLRLDAVDEQGKGLNLGISNGAFSTEVVARDRPLAEKLGVTPDDERAVVGLVPALFAFFDVVIKTPGLKEIFFEMVDKVSLGWSVLTHRGNVEPTFGFDSNNVGIMDTARWGVHLPPTYDLTIPLALNGKPALTCRFMATRPEPPLLVTAGIIGLYAKNPRDAGRELVIRALAARPAPPPRS